MAKVMSPENFVLGQNASLWLDKATAEEIKVMGLQGLGLALGFSQQSTTVPMMGQRIAPRVYTGAEYDEMSINANFIPGDKSQDKLRQAALQSKLLKNVRMYVKDGCSFSAPDQISAGGGLTSGTSGLMVGSFSDPQIGSPSDLFTNTVTMAPAGPFTLFVAHSDPGKGDEITISDGGAGSEVTLTTTGTIWGEQGFEVGDTVLVDWSDTTPKYGKVSSINTDTMKLEADVGDAASISTGQLPAKGAVHGGTAAEVSGQDIACN